MRVSHEVQVSAPAEEVWRALTDPDLTRRYYYDMAVVADWGLGGTVSYEWAPGQAGESGFIAEIEPGRRLVLETRLLYAPSVRQEPAHRTTWELEPSAAGTTVKLTMEVPDSAPVTARLLEDDGGTALKGLRVTVDPAARAELARRPQIGKLEIKAVARERVSDYHLFFDEIAFRDHPAWSFCYCIETHHYESDEANALRTRAENRADMTRMIESGEVTALLAYADGRPVAWCDYGETTRLTGVMRKLGLDTAEQEGVGSLACFVIAAPYRRHGIAQQLLAAACEKLAERGCKTVEAYPRSELDSEWSGYRGPLAMYLRAGFEPYREVGRTVVVRKALR